MAWSINSCVPPGSAGRNCWPAAMRSLPAEEPVGVGSQVLEAIEDLEPKAPVVLVIDDAHWADLDSLRALLFVVRRLVGDPGPGASRACAVRTHIGCRKGCVGRQPARTGTTIALGALPASEIAHLAAALGVPHLSGRSARHGCMPTPKAIRSTSPRCWPNFPAIVGRPGNRCFRRHGHLRPR